MHWYSLDDSDREDEAACQKVMLVPSGRINNHRLCSRSLSKSPSRMLRGRRPRCDKSASLLANESAELSEPLRTRPRDSSGAGLLAIPRRGVGVSGWFGFKVEEYKGMEKLGASGRRVLVTGLARPAVEPKAGGLGCVGLFGALLAHGVADTAGGVWRREPTAAAVRGKCVS